jgi:GNAT superfamily N-acetyltransferase
VETTHPVTIRPARTDDLPALGRLGALLVRAHHDFDAHRFMAPGPHPEEGYAWFLGTQIDSDEALVLVAERDDVIVGYVFASVEPLSWKELREEAGFIHDLLTIEAMRGRGVGHALLDAAIAWLFDKGMPRVMLWTAEANHEAQALFAHRGFRRTMVEMTIERESRRG